MAQIEGKYETIFILDPSLSEEDTQGLVTKFKTLVEENSTTVNVEEWGNRRLAYPINDYTEGYYTLISFSSKPEFPAELTRIYKITDGVMRHMIIAVA